MIETDKFDKIEIESPEDLRNWLSQNYSNENSFWLVTYKKSETTKYVSRWDVLDELLCFGWIDGIRRKLDDKRTMQLISKRKVEHWAKSTLSYEVPKNTLISITIYDLLGNVVRNLVNINQSPGFKSIQWNATNNQGQPVSAGVYLYSIEAGEFMQTKKMILLK